MGILPLDQPSSEHGQIQDPVMICPICDDEFQAIGIRWRGRSTSATMPRPTKWPWHGQCLVRTKGGAPPRLIPSFLMAGENPLIETRLSLTVTFASTGRAI